MTQIQLIDLCSRVPYHPKGHVVNAYNGAECDEWLTCATFPMFTSITNNSRLYLRPMSSMTEEEDKEWKQTFKSVYDVCPGGDPDNEDDFYDWHDEPSIDSIDWLNSHHFDYRGLIEKGLALAITGENNPYKE